MDDAASFLQNQRDAVLAMERALELARAELRGMEAFASAFAKPRQSTGLRVGAPVASASPNRPSSSGRQPGSISNRWRMVLADLCTFSDLWFSAEDVAATVRNREKRDVRLPEIRRIMDGYIVHRYVEKDEHGLYRVTEHAVEKFGLMNAYTEEQSGAANAREENEPPSVSAEDGSEIALDAQ